MNKKILLVTNIPTPYRIPLFNKLDDLMKSSGLSLKVIFGAKGYPRRRWKISMTHCRFAHEVLPSRIFWPGNKERAFFAYGGLAKTIRRERPDAVICSGFSIATMKVWLFTLISNLPYFIWSGDTHRKKTYSLLRDMQRRILIRRAKGFIAYGSKAIDYLISLGADPQRIFLSINTVDVAYFSARSAQLRKATSGRLSTGLKKRILYVGDLSPRKNVLKLLEVLKVISRLRTDVVLDIVGDGQQRSKLETYVRENGLERFVKFHGFQQKETLALFYAASYCFVFQTDFDIWGLVLNEAMATGTPCIASINAGATCDLIVEGETGFALDIGDRLAVSKRIGWLLDNPEHARRVGNNARLFIEKYASIEVSAAGFVRALGLL